MARLLPVLMCVACISPGGGGGGSSASPTLPPGTTPVVTGGTGGTVTVEPIVPYLPPEDDDGTLAAVAPITRLIASAGESVAEVVSGDFDGNGIYDLAFRSQGDTWVWFGPLPTGDHAIQGAQVQLVEDSPVGVGDYDGDGRDELGLFDHLIAVPDAGVVTDIASLSVFEVEEGVAGAARFADVDGDGFRDAVLADEWDALWVFYGPLGSQRSMLSGQPDAGSALMRGVDPGCKFAGPVYDLGDVTGDGLPEFAVLEGEMMHWSSEDGNCLGDERSNLVFPGGDHRGQTLSLVDAVQGGLPYDLQPIGDVDGDGRDELGNQAGIYTAAALFAGGAGAEALAWPGPDVTFVEGHPGVFLDLSGDGRMEIQLVAGGEHRATDAATSVGEVAAEMGRVIDPTLGSLALVADVTGDGVPDGVVTIGQALSVYSGATLVERWAQ